MGIMVEWASGPPPKQPANPLWSGRVREGGSEFRGNRAGRTPDNESTPDTRQHPPPPIKHSDIPPKGGTSHVSHGRAGNPLARYWPSIAGRPQAGTFNQATTSLHLYLMQRVFALSRTRLRTEPSFSSHQWRIRHAHTRMQKQLVKKV